MSAQNIIPRIRAGAGRSDGSTGLCGMQVISRQNGDARITDLPSCADPMLSRIVQQVNDTHCTHRDGDLLCPPCSVEVLALAHRTAGTVLTGWDDLAVRRVWVRLALDEAESVAHPDEDVQIARCREAVAAWLDDPSPANSTRAAAAAAPAARRATTTARRAAYAAAAAATMPTRWAAADAAAAFASATRWATRLERAHRLIDRFEALTGVSASTPDPDVTVAALDAMRRVTS